MKHNKHIHSLLGNGIIAGTGMLVSIVLFRVLSIAEMGAWIVFFSTILLFDTIRSGIITMAFVKFFSGTSDQRANAVIGSTWYLAIVITLFLLLLNIPMYVVSFYINSAGFAYFLKWFGIIYTASLPFFVISCLLQAKQRFDQLLLLRLFNQGSFLLLLLLFVWLKMINLQMTIFAYLISNGIASIVGLFLGWGDVYKLKFRSKKVVKEIISFGKFSVGTNLSATLLGSVDTYIINFMLGPTALAVFNTGIRLLQVVEIPLLSFASTAMPTLSTLYNQGNQKELVKVAKKYIAIVTILFIPMIVLSFLFGDLAVWILAGSKYVHTEAPNILRLFMILSLIYPLDRFLALIVDVIHKPQVNLLKVVCMLAVNIIVDVLCIYYFKSIYCVVLGAILAMLTAVAISSYTLKKYYIKISLIDIYKQLSFATIKSFIFNNGK